MYCCCDSKHRDHHSQASAVLLPSKFTRPDVCWSSQLSAGTRQIYNTRKRHKRPSKGSSAAAAAQLSRDGLDSLYMA
jgi:hypothetical protein